MNGNGSTWEGELAFGANDGLEAVIGTNTTGDFVTFEVNSSVAFAMYGVNGPHQGAFLVDINPPLPFNASAPATFNASSPWVMIEEIKYLVGGLNDTETYTVNFSNADPGKQFNIGEVVLYSTVPPCVHFIYVKDRYELTQRRSASPTTSASSGSSTHPRNALSRGSIAGATVRYRHYAGTGPLAHQFISGRERGSSHGPRFPSLCLLSPRKAPCWSRFLRHRTGGDAG